jgi:hypothetical protein
MAEDGGVKSKEKGEGNEDEKEQSWLIGPGLGGVMRPDVGVYGPKLDEDDEKLFALEGGR